MEWLESPLVLSLGIFSARVADVSLGTLRTILLFRGHPKTAAAIGFAEVMIWLLAVGKVLENLDHWYYAVSFAGGFATGNIVGIWFESKLALGAELVRAISHDRAIDLAPRLRERGYAVTEFAGHGDGRSPVEVLLIVERRRRVPALLAEIRAIDPNAIITISDIKRQVALSPAEGMVPTGGGWRSRNKRK